MHVARAFAYRQLIFQRVAAIRRILIRAQRIELRRGGFLLPVCGQLLGVSIHRAVQRGLRLFRFRQLFQPADRRLVVARFQRRVAQRRRHIRKFLRRILIVARREQLFRRLFKLACRKGVRARRVAADLSARLRVFVDAEALKQCGCFLIVARLLLFKAQRIAALADERNRVARVRNLHELVARGLILSFAHQLAAIEIDAVRFLCRRILIIAERIEPRNGRRIIQLLLGRFGDVINQPVQCALRFLIVLKRGQKRLRRADIAVGGGQFGTGDDRFFFSCRVADSRRAQRRLLIGRVRADVHQAVDNLLFRRVHARLCAKLLRPVSVDQRIQLLGVRRKTAIQFILSKQAHRVRHAPARRRQQQRDKRQQQDRRAQALFLLLLLFLHGFHLFHGLFAGSAQRFARLFLQHAFLAPKRRIDCRKGICLHRVRPVPPAAQTAVVAGAVCASADAEPDLVVLARIAHRVRPGDRAQPIQFAPRRQGVRGVFAHIALFPPPDHAVLIPDLLHGGFYPRDVFHVLRRKCAGEVFSRFAVRARAHKPPADPLLLRVKADDIHLNAVDHLIRKVEKIDQAENLPVFICILGFPLNRHMDDLNRTG